MSFDLYFAGVQSFDAEERIEELEALRLLSYLNDQTRLKRRIGKELTTFVDSGAFTAWSKGKEIDIDTYCDWLNEYDEFVKIAAELDHIPGRKGQPRTHQQNNEGGEKSWQNYLHMAERVKSWEKILPVFHQGEDFKYLVRMLEHTPKIPYIGISTNKEVSQLSRNVWMDKVFHLIKHSNHPNVKTHAFGMTSLPALEIFPFTSADSTSWIMTGANGAIMTKYGIIGVSEKNRGDVRYFEHLPKPIREELESYVGEKGFTLKELSEHYTPRMLFNIQYLYEWAQNYTYKPKSVRQATLF